MNTNIYDTLAKKNIYSLTMHVDDSELNKINLKFPDLLLEVSETLKRVNNELHKKINLYAEGKIKQSCRQNCDDSLPKMLKRDFYWRILYILESLQKTQKNLTLEFLVKNLNITNVLTHGEVLQYEQLQHNTLQRNGGSKTKRIKNKNKGRRSRRM